MKKILIHIRRSMRLILLIAFATILIFIAISGMYKPTYSVTLNGEFVGYTNEKSELQKKINEYIEKGEGGNVAFVKIDTLPEYSLCLLKRETETNDEEIFEKVKSLGTTYYKYFAVTEGTEEKVYVSSREEAEKIVEGLKEKNSENKDKIAFTEKYNTELATLVDTETAISKLYVKPTPVITYASKGTVTTSAINWGKKVNIGVNLIRPISGIITSRFGSRASGTHKGLDIAANTGTPIKAAAAGTVTYSGYRGSWGNLVIISHGNGVETYYAHCSALYVKVGAKVAQGQQIAAVGSTGNSTGPHLHLEIHVNGVIQNPQNYLY